MILTLEFVTFFASFYFASIGLWRPQVGQTWRFKTQLKPTKLDLGASVETPENTIELHGIGQQWTFENCIVELSASEYTLKPPK